jgi:DNA recombination protein RmuC
MVIQRYAFLWQRLKYFCRLVDNQIVQPVLLLEFSLMSVELLVASVSLVLAFGIVGWAVFRRPPTDRFKIEELTASREALQECLDEKIAECTDLLQRSAASESALLNTTTRLQAAESDGKELTHRYQSVLSNLSAAQVTVESLIKERDALALKVEDLQHHNSTLSSQRIDMERQLAGLQASLSSSKESLELYKAGQAESEKRFEQQMKELAGRLLSEHSEKFRKASKDEIDTVLSPFREMLDSTKKQLQTHEGAAKAQTELIRQQLERLIAENEAMARLFKGENNKALGNLGEHILERLLSAAGLAENTHYKLQSKYETDEDKRRLPDATILFPDDKRLFIDAKASIKNYNEAISAADAKSKERYLTALVKDLQVHIEALSKKRYDLLAAGDSLDFVLMFVPFEQAYLAALEQAPTLAEDALRKNVAIVTNSTLLATLRTISYIWKQDLQQKSVYQVTNQVGKMLVKFENFLGDMDDLGKQLGSAQKSYDGAINKLTRGRGNLAGHMHKLKNIGAVGKKDLCNRIWQEVDVEDDDETSSMSTNSDSA